MNNRVCPLCKEDHFDAFDMRLILNGEEFEQEYMICFHCVYRLHCIFENKQPTDYIQGIKPPERGSFWEKQDAKFYEDVEAISGLNDDLLSKPQEIK